MTKRFSSKLLSVFFALFLGAAAETAAANPYAVFIVHCEPNNADAESFLELSELVAAADLHGVRVTIDFTPPWAKMILENDSFLESVEEWTEAGHEIGVHHHPYGVSLVRNTQWDGYTNTDLANVDAGDLPNYLGDMFQFMAVLNALPGTRTSGTLGLSLALDLGDFPQSLTYSARGHEFSEVVSRPEVVVYEDQVVWEMTHGLFWNATLAELASAYDSAGSDEIFAVVTHVSNYEASPAAVQQVEDFFAFLSSRDPLATKLVTVTSAMDATLPAVPALTPPGVGVLVGLLLGLGAARLRSRRAAPSPKPGRSH